MGMPFELVVPEGYLPFTFAGCLYTGFPFPSLINIKLKVKKQDTGTVHTLTCVKNLANLGKDDHDHFDPVGKLRSNFIVLKGIVIYTKKAQICQQQETKSEYEGYQNVTQDKKRTVEVDVIRGISLTYAKRMTDGKKISPYEAHKNPDWKNKEWVENTTESHRFQLAPPDNELDTHIVDLTNPDEFITRVQGQGNTYISNLEFTTNFGRRVSVGHSLPDFFKDNNIVSLPRQMVPKTKKFDLNVPKGSKVVCIAGAYNENLITLQAHYQ